MERRTRPLETDQQPPEKHQPAPFKNRTDEEGDIEGSFSFRFKRIPDEHGTADSSHNAKEEKYWRQQVRWLRITAIATIAAFAAAAVYAGVAKNQRETMQEQLAAMQETNRQTRENIEATRQAANAAERSAAVAEQALVISERPWISVTLAITKPLTFDEKGAHIQLGGVLKNVGRSVAVDVYYSMEMVLLDPPPSMDQAALNWQKQSCDARRHIDPQDLHGDVLFPKQPISIQYATSVTKEQILKAQSVETFMGKGKVGFAIVGCAYYKASFEQPEVMTHQTRFLYLLADLSRFADMGAFGPRVDPIGVHPEMQLLQSLHGNVVD